MAKLLIDSKRFLSLPVSAQALYFHMDARSNSDGYCEKPASMKKISSQIESDMKTLIDNRFVIEHGDGLIVVGNMYIHELLIKLMPVVKQEESDAEGLPNFFSSENADELRRNFDTIYASYPKKGGRATAFTRYKAWVTNGRIVEGKRVKLTNAQIWDAIDRYKRQLESNDTDMKFYKNFDTLMGNALYDYVEVIE